MFAKAGRLKLSVKSFGSRRIFCKYKESRHRLVEPVDEAKIGFSFLLPGTMEVVFQDAYHIRCTDAFALGRDSRGLYTDNDLFIFENNFRCYHISFPSPFCLLSKDYVYFLEGKSKIRSIMGILDFLIAV